MAVTVPRYDPNQVRQENLPNARYSAAGADVGADSIGRGLQQVGGVLGQIAQQEKQKVDTAAVMQAEAELRQYQNTVLFGDGTGQNIGAFGTKGKDAFGLPERILPDLDKKRSEIAARLNGGQRSMFENRTADWTTQTQGDLLRHVARESDAYTKETTKAYIDASAQTAVLYYNDPKRVDSEIQRAQDAYIVGNPGDPPEATRLALQTIESQTRRNILNRLMTESPSQAQAYYQQYRDKFIGSDQAEIERVLNPLVKADLGDSIARTLLSGGALPMPSQSGVSSSYRDAIASIESRGSGDYSAMGPVTKNGDRAYGRYQVMGNNIPEWTKAALGKAMTPEQFLADQSAQDAVFDHRFGMYVRKYGPEGAARAWFGGEGAVNKPDAKDVLGTSVAEYGKKFVAAAGGADAGAGAVVPPMSATEAKQWALDNIHDRELRNNIISRIETEERLNAQREAETEKALLQSINAKVEQADPSMPLAKIVTPQELAWAQQTGRVDSWEARLKQRAAGDDEVTPRDQLLAYRDVVYQAARGDEAAKRELSRYRPYDPKLRMAQADRDWLYKAQADVLSGDPSKMAKAASEGEINNVIQSYAINTLGVDKKKLATDPRAIEFDRSMRLWADQFQRQNQRAPTYTEVLKQADLMTLNSLSFTKTVPGSLFGWAGSTDKVEVKVGDLGMSSIEKMRAIQFLRDNNKPVTGNNVQYVFENLIKPERERAARNR